MTRDRPPAPADRPAAGRGENADAEAWDEGGDPVCWLPRVCPACGRLADEEPPTRCPACGEPIPVA